MAFGRKKQPPIDPIAVAQAQRAREEMELLLGTKVYLDLHVKVLKEWQRDPRALERLGF